MTLLFRIFCHLCYEALQTNDTDLLPRAEFLRKEKPRRAKKITKKNKAHATLISDHDFG
jgi:hypothetical protein